MEREILVGRDAVVLSWKNILASVLCLIASGVANDNLLAQTTNQGYSRPGQYYQATQNVDRSSLRERLASGETSARQNAGTSAARRPLTSAEIWSTFLFGGVQRQTSAPKFAFSRKTQNGANNGSGATKPNYRSFPVHGGNVDPNQSVYATRPTNEPFNGSNGTTSAPSTASGGLLPDPDGAYVVENRSAQGTPIVVNDGERRRRIAELNVALDSRASNARPSADAASQITNESVALINRSKIRQTSGVAPQTTENAEPGERETLPVRPRALQISPRVFVSTEVVQLPQAGALVDETPDAETPDEDPLVAVATKEERAPEVEPVEEEVAYDIPTFDSQIASQDENARAEAVAPLPLAPSPLPQVSKSNGSESRVLRSRAKFLDPRSL